MSSNVTIPLTWEDTCHAVCKTLRTFDLVFTGTATVDNSPDVDLYLHIDGDPNKPGLYVPDDCYIAVTWTAVLSSPEASATVVGESETGLIENDGGTMTYVGGAIGSGVGNCTITPTVNDTLDVLELVVSDSDSEQLTHAVVEGHFVVLYTESCQSFGGSTSAIS